MYIFVVVNTRSRIVSRELVKHSERISFVSAVNSNRLLNRRMVRDLMEYLDAVRPPNLGINEWDDIIVRNLKVQANHVNYILNLQYIHIYRYIHTYTYIHTYSNVVNAHQSCFSVHFFCGQHTPII
jgi:hypothetical protein